MCPNNAESPDALLLCVYGATRVCRRPVTRAGVWCALGEEERSRTDGRCKVVSCGEHHEGGSDAVQQVRANQTRGMCVVNSSGLIDRI